MDYKEDFSRLEGIVEKLLANLDKMKRDNLSLQAALRQKEQENNALRDEGVRLSDEKIFVHKRVTDLISTIGEWEKLFLDGDQATE